MATVNSQLLGAVEWLLYVNMLKMPILLKIEKGKSENKARMGAISSVMVILGLSFKRLIRMMTFLDSSIGTETHFNTFNDYFNY